MTKFQLRLIQALKELRLSSPATTIAARMGTSSGSIGTGMRPLVKMRCVSMTFKKGLAYYRLLRVKPKSQS